MGFGWRRLARRWRCPFVRGRDSSSSVVQVGSVSKPRELADPMRMRGFQFWRARSEKISHRIIPSPVSSRLRSLRCRLPPSSFNAGLRRDRDVLFLSHNHVEMSGASSRKTNEVHMHMAHVEKEQGRLLFASGRLRIRLLLAQWPQSGHGSLSLLIMCS